MDFPRRAVIWAAAAGRRGCDDEDADAGEESDACEDRAWDTVDWLESRRVWLESAGLEAWARPTAANGTGEGRHRRPAPSCR